MTDIVRLLPDNIANQIAAGEVVQRPASVVKELLENAVDSGAKNIKLLIKNGGRGLIQVIDDGCGMSETDARMSFERHATSKIRNLDDLYAIHTLGFRGEALASIAAVAQVEMKTRRRSSDVGTLICIENSEVQKQEPCATPEGTSIAVKNLFYNVPARRNFLKSNPVEIRHIMDEFIRVALANPEIHFSLMNEAEEVYHLKQGNLRQRIVGIFGKKYEEALVPVDEATDILTIKGFIGKPEWARKTRGEQFFFANNRFIRNAYLHHAVASAYEELLPSDSHPFYTIFLELDPSKIDINVHPTKTEIKFVDEKVIYAILRAAVRKSLNQYHVAPSLNFEEEMSMRVPEPMQNRPYSRDEPPATWMSSISSSPLQKNRSRPEDWLELYKSLDQKVAQAQKEEEESSEDDAPGSEDLLDVAESVQKPVMQLHQKYIITSIRSGLMIVHQQWAHERILYEKYLDTLENSKSFSQRLLFPEVIQLQPADFVLVKEILPGISSLGFELEEFGKNAFVMNGIPAGIPSQSQQNILEKIIEDYKNTAQGQKLEKNEKLARALAKNTAIKVGRVLAYEEMTQLIDELFACQMPYYSPDGRPAVVTMSSDELDKKFKN